MIVNDIHDLPFNQFDLEYKKYFYCDIDPIINEKTIINSDNITDLDDNKVGSIKKARWTSIEDLLLVDVIKKYGSKNWSFIATFIPGRTGKQCRERWIVQHDPSFKRESFSNEEDNIIIHYQGICGNRWSIISKFLPGRSTTNVKNRWKYLKNHGIISPKINYVIQNNNSTELISNLFDINSMPDSFDWNYE